MAGSCFFYVLNNQLEDHTPNVIIASGVNLFHPFPTTKTKYTVSYLVLIYKILKIQLLLFNYS